ncbi:MAG: M23 family metallopeptidase [Anaerolineae bacterium]|nr:M23 family metallopeptidase [Anaerolineae bacterium]
MRLTGGDFQSLGLGSADSFPAPVVNSWWVRDYNLDPNFTFVHYGWDLAAAVGEPLFAPPVPSRVAVASLCRACTPAKPNAQAHGFKTGDSSIVNSPEWNYGYGHMVGLRVLHQDLPASAQAELARRNLTGYHLYIIYAHMNSIEVQAGAELQAGQRIGTLGNTGNSEGPHLHLEVRAWNNPNETSLGASFKNHMTPAVVFRR